MPRLAAFYGIVIYLYARDHGPAHVHARYGDDWAMVEINRGAVIAGRLGRRQAALVATWVAAHRDELAEAWSRASAGEPPGTIEALP